MIELVHRDINRFILVKPTEKEKYINPINIKVNRKRNPIKLNW